MPCNSTLPAATQDGHTPLLAAACRGRLEVVRALIIAGANKEAKDKVGAGADPALLAWGSMQQRAAYR